jgi:hypothetical protein
MRYVIAFAVLTCSAVRAAEPPKAQDSITVAGSVEKPGDWTCESLAKEFAADVKEISYTLKGQSAKARVVPLAKLVMAAKPTLDPKQKNHIIAFAVVIRAKDGYAATFSMGELLPEFAGAEVYLALDRDGGPSSERERPVSLLVVGDKKPSRWVHGIETVTVIDGLAASKK